MKVLFRKFMLVFLGTFLIGTIGNEAYGYNGYVENKGRIGCGVCPAVYWPGETHVCSAVAVAPDTSSYGQVVCPDCGTHHPSPSTGFRHSCPIPVRVVKKTTSVVQKGKYSQPTYEKTKSYSSYNFFPVQAFIRIEKRRPVVIYRSIYGGYYRPGFTAWGNPVIWNKKHRGYYRW